MPNSSDSTAPALGVPILPPSNQPIRQGVLYPSAEGIITSQQIYASFMRAEPTVSRLEAIKRAYQLSSEQIPPSKEVALRRAAFQGNVEHIEALVLNYETDVNAKGQSNGFTALDWAYEQNQMDAVNTLCWLQADQSLVKPLLNKYTRDDEDEWPVKDEALRRAVVADALEDVCCLVERYHATVSDEVLRLVRPDSAVAAFFAERATRPHL